MGLGRRLLKLLRPRWLLWHAICWGAAYGMVLLGRWQLRVSDAKHFDLQNFSYTIQWWAFATFAVAFWAKTIRDALRPPKATEVAEAGELVLRSKPGTELDGAHYQGPAEFVGEPAAPGEMPVVYRGYRIPQSSAAPFRSDDSTHGEYNDYLWQLALADAAAQGRSVPAQPPPSGLTESPIIDAALSDTALPPAEAPDALPGPAGRRPDIEA